MRSALISAFLAVTLLLSGTVHAETVAGTVVGLDGKPIVATVFYVSRGLWNSAEQVTQSAPDGTFRFEVEPVKPPTPDSSRMRSNPADRGGVAAYAPGLSLRLGLLKAGDPNIIRLLPPRKIKGVLRDGKGAPVGGATVRLNLVLQNFSENRNSESVFFALPEQLRKPFSTRTGADGAWEISDVSVQGTLQVTLDDENYVPSAVQYEADADIPSGPGSRDMVAIRAGSISGRVVDPQGLLSAGVQILAVAKSQPEQRNAYATKAYGKTDAEGAFRIAKLPPGVYNLRIGAAVGAFSFGAAPSPVSLLAAPALENVLVEAGKATSGTKFQLVKPAKVNGLVLNHATGKPLAGIAVGAFGKSSPRSLGVLPMTESDAEGRFELSLVPGDNALYAYEGNRWGGWNDDPSKDLATVPVQLEAESEKTLSLSVDRRFADASGQVVDEAGHPMAGVEIILWNTAGTGQTLYSDEQGNFVMKRLPPGSLRLDPSEQWSLIGPKNIELSTAEEANVKIVVRANEMAKVTGRVVDAAGQPVANAKLRYSMPFPRDGQENSRNILQATSDEKGAFTFPQLKMPEALQLALDGADAKSYKFRSGGTPPKAANAGLLSLSNIVLDRLSIEIHGVVQNEEGGAVEGALVRGSGDSFENTATTDAAGKFTLAGQSEGELELLAVQGRSFGRAHYTTGQPKIVLKPVAAVQPKDVALAAKLFTEMAPIADTRTLGAAITALAPYDALTSQTILLAVKDAQPDAVRKQVLQALTKDSSDASLAWAQNELTKIEDNADFIEAGSRLGLVLAVRRPADAQALFGLVNKRLAGVTAGRLNLSTAWVAALASRLKSPDAPELADRALAGAGGDFDRTSELVIPFASGTAELAEQALESLPPHGESNVYEYRQAIERLALYDAPGAERLLKTMRELVDAVPELPEENGTLRGRAALEYTWAFAAKAVLRSLDRADATSADQIARQVKLWHRPSALALAAEFGDRENRLAMTREAVAAEERGDWMKNVTLPRLGALVAELDPAMAATFFGDSAQSLEQKRHKEGFSGSNADWGFYAAFWNPAQALLALEASWGRLHQKTPLEDRYDVAEWNKESLAKAMSAVDIDRALEWARDLSDKSTPNNASQRAGALAFIGELLLTEPAQRRLMVIAPESGYDS